MSWSTPASIRPTIGTPVPSAQNTIERVRIPGSFRRADGVSRSARAVVSRRIRSVSRYTRAQFAMPPSRIVSPTWVPSRGPYCRLSAANNTAATAQSVACAVTTRIGPYSTTSRSRRTCAASSPGLRRNRRDPHSTPIGTATAM